MDIGDVYISGLNVKDIRFPTSLESDGSDAMHSDPDYSCAYVVLTTSDNWKGFGLTFTIGRGTEIVVAAVRALSVLVVGRKLNGIYENFANFWRELTSDTQIRWIGPEKGVIHLATAAIVNALWDLWARREGKPLWKLLTDMWFCCYAPTEDADEDEKDRFYEQLQDILNSVKKGDFTLVLGDFNAKVGTDSDLWGGVIGPFGIGSCNGQRLLQDPIKLVSAIDFRYITDAITKEEAVEILQKHQNDKAIREQEISQMGYPAYCTSVGWIGYDDDKIKQLCKERLEEGFTKFKAKVGLSIESDKRRLSLIRGAIGKDSSLMVDANQKWDVQEAIAWMKALASFKLLWIEEPTSPDDILGHATIAKELEPMGIGVATGEQCHNRVMFKQFLQAEALQFCQIDCCRLGGVNEVLAVYLMAAKYGVPVCPHAGGVGLCELVQHLAIWDYNCVSASLDNRMVEYVEHLHEHFKTPITVKGGQYQVPQDPGYSCEMKEESIAAYEYPNGLEWKKLFEQGKFTRPSLS